MTDQQQRYTDRERVLDGARTAVMQERNNQYGPPTQDFDRSAGILNAMGYTGPGGRALTGHDIAIIQMAVKLSRLTWRPNHVDSWVDLAGYAACGFECAQHEDMDAAKILDQFLPKPDSFAFCLWLDEAEPGTVIEVVHDSLGRLELTKNGKGLWDTHPNDRTQGGLWQTKRLLETYGPESVRLKSRPVKA